MAAAESAAGDESSGEATEPEPEESIYDTMKAARGQEGIAGEGGPIVAERGTGPGQRNARTGRRGNGARRSDRNRSGFSRLRQGVGGGGNDLAVASAAIGRRAGRMLQGQRDRSGGPREATITVPGNQRNFTTEKARMKLEEALRAVTGVPLRVKVEFVEISEEEMGHAGAGGGRGAIGVVGGPGSGLPAMQRIPPELLEKIRNQPLIKELAKRFDAAITHVEILSPAAKEPEAPSE